MTAKAFSVGFIGCGNMAQAIINGMLKANLYRPEEIIASNRSQEKLAQFCAQTGIVKAESNNQVAMQAQIVVIAVKPQQFAQVAAEIKPYLDKNTAWVSLMAGVTLTGMAEALGDSPIVRAMPNTPAQIGAGVTALCQNQAVDEQTMAKIKGIFATVGETISIDESLIDAVSAISGCGPAYVYQIIEAMADGGVMIGLPRALAYQLAAQTMVGAGRMVLETNLHPAALKDQVTSPGGSTIRAVNALEQGGLRGTMMAAVEAAYLKSKQLGEIKS